MKKFSICSIILLMMATGVCLATNDIGVFVESTLISDETWQLDYTVSNFSLEVIKEVTVEFDFDEFDNLIDVSSDGLGCDIKVWPAITQTHDGWAFDVLFDTPVGSGDSFTGISMLVDYTGDGEPEMQYYLVSDPMTFAKIADGYTVPEPATVTMIGLCGLGVIRRRRRRRFGN